MKKVKPALQFMAMALEDEALILAKKLIVLGIGVGASLVLFGRLV